MARFNNGETGKRKEIEILNFKMSVQSRLTKRQDKRRVAVVFHFIETNLFFSFSIVVLLMQSLMLLTSK